MHALRYSVFSFLLDLKEIDLLDQSLWLFSRNRFNLFGFYDKDFGERSGESLAVYVARKLDEARIATPVERVYLSCYPRVLGYGFNPLSLFYCLDKEGRCFAIIHEVHNTFGERHAYVLPVEMQSSAEVKGEDQWIHQNADKALFVSPFASMGMRYEFRLNQPDETQVVVIKAFDDEGLLITASYCAQRHALSASRLFRFFLTYPLLSIKVVLGIHWEAFRLWLKKAPLYKHLPKRSAKHMEN